MAFCDKEKQLIDGGYTLVDNRFILTYLADAPDVRSAVYLLGLALADSEGTDNCCETIAQKLNISCDDVMSAFLYWEELGLVSVTETPQTHVTYLSVRDWGSAQKKIKPSKYAKFSKTIQQILAGRMITVNEYNEYYTFLENTTFEQDALLAVAQYCAELKGNAINYKYILTVARNFARKGATTAAAVNELMDSGRKYDDDLKLVFKALKLQRSFDHADREMYEKWTKDYGFAPEVIFDVAKGVKSGGMGKLDGMLGEYYRSGVYSMKEIADYTAQKTRLYELARAINKSLGVYYQSLDMIVDEYILNWQRKGFDDETLLAVAKYCFKSGIRTLNGLASVIDKLYKNGVTDIESLGGYLAALADADEKIQNVLTKCGLDRKPCPNDRVLFRTWTQLWNVPVELIDYAAEQAAGLGAPMAYINRLLSDYKQHGISTLEQAKGYRADRGAAATTAATATVARRKYTDEEISALFTVLDETED